MSQRDCGECRNDEENGHVPVPREQTLQLKTTPEDVVDAVERAALRVVLVQCQSLHENTDNPYAAGSARNLAWMEGRKDAIAAMETILVMTIGN